MVKNGTSTYTVYVFQYVHQLLVLVCCEQKKTHIELECVRNTHIYVNCWYYWRKWSQKTKQSMSAYTNTRIPIPLQTEQMKILNQIGSYCDSTKCFASFIPIFIFICVSLPVVHSAHYVYSEWLDFSQLLPLFGSVFECICICENYSVLYFSVRVKIIQIIV